jgi:hypothetical protein
MTFKLSFVTKRFDRVQSRRATCGQPGCDECGYGKQHRRGDKSDWIECANFVQDSADYFSSRGSEKKAKRDATKKHDGAFLHDHAQYSAWLSTERHPDADLTRAPRDRISFDSVETNYGQTKRKSPKDGEQRRASTNKPEIQVRIEMLRERSQRNDRD